MSMPTSERLEDRLRAYGTLLDSPSARTSSAEATRLGGLPQPRFRALVRRSIVVVLLAGCTATGAFVATRPRTPDPIVSVIPKDLKVKDVAWIEAYTADGETSREVSLVTVGSIDAVVTKFRGDSPLVKNADEEQFEVAGDSVFTVVNTYPVYGDRTGARWGLADGTLYSATLLADRQTSLVAIEQLVLQSRTPNDAGNTSATPVTEVARWIEDGSSVRYRFGVPVVQTDSSGVTRVVRPGPVRGEESFSTTRSDIPEEVLPRVRAVLQPWVGKSVRSGAFVVAGNVADDGLRPVRQSGLRRLIKQVDRARAAEIAEPYWKRLTKDLEYSDTYGATCVRSRTDVSCGQSSLNRLVGKTWVYATFRPNGGDVLANGQVLRGVSTADGRTIYIVPSQTRSIQSTFRQPDLTTLTRSVERPNF